MNYKQAYNLQNDILHGKLSKEKILKVFESLAKRQLQPEEFRGFVDASKANMLKLETGFDCLDTCGTGGDKLGTFNISTAAALVCAAGGAKVAKHGNRCVSSKSGSADVLEALGVKINLDTTAVKKCLEKAGIVFLFAPNFHPAFKNVSEARKEYGQRTYFNFLGPLLNPALPKFQVLGVADQYMKGLMSEVLLKSDIQNAMLVSSIDGMDEINTIAPTEITQIQAGKLVKFRIDPQNLGMHPATLEDIQGGTAQENAKILLAIFNNQATIPQTEIVILNAGAGLLVAGIVETLELGIKLASELISSGKVLAKLNKFIKTSNES